MRREWFQSSIDNTEVTNHPRNYNEWNDLISEEIHYYIVLKLTIREIAKLVHRSKSAVHVDLHERAEQYIHTSIIKEIKLQSKINSHNGVLKGGKNSQRPTLKT